VCTTGEGNLSRFRDYREAVILNRITDDHKTYPRSLELVSSKLYGNCLSPWRVKRWRQGDGESRQAFGKVKTEVYSRLRRTTNLSPQGLRH